MRVVSYAAPLCLASPGKRGCVGDSLTYKRTGRLDRPEKAWSQDGGNMRVFAHEVTC